MAMDIVEILEKLKSDINIKKANYNKELQKMEKESVLLNYINGMLDITGNNVNNFP